MGGPLFAVKTHLPLHRSDLVPRSWLVERLNLVTSQKLILVSAPAGFGKTSLLSSWINQTKIPVGWVSLDEDDNDPVRFLSYLLNAFQSIDKGIGENIQPVLNIPKPPPSMTLLAYLVNDIAAKNRMVVVLDDYHVIKNQEVNEIIGYLLQYQPQNFHLVISTRVDPPLHLARMRAREELIEIREADLRFTDQEAIQFFDRMMADEISNQDVSELNQRTEGWITGLHMAMLSMQSKVNKKHFIQSFTGSNRYVIDYLLEEVLDQQPQEIRTFLLKTSILTQHTASLCQALTDNQDCQKIIERMERDNLFVVQLDERREWYRYHHLFSDLLRQYLLMETPEIVTDLHRRASIWYERNDYLGWAIDHALAAGDFENMLRLINAYLAHIWEYGDQVKLTKWLSSLPEDIITKYPMVLAHYAFALCLAGQYDEAEKKVCFIERAIKNTPEEIEGMIATVRAFHSLYRNEIQKAADYALIALDKLGHDDHLWRSLALSIHGDVHAFYGHIPKCESIWNEALIEAQKGGSVFMELIASAKLIVARKRLGRLREACQTFREQIERTSASGYEMVAYAGALYAVWADILLEWNRIEEAIENIEHGLFFCERQKYMAGLAWCSISLINARFCQNDLSAAEDALQSLDGHISQRKLPAWTSNWRTAWKVRLAITRGDIRSAEDCLEDRNINLNGKFAYPNEVEYLAFARLLIAKAGQDPESLHLTEAEKLLNRMQMHLQKRNWIDKMIETEVLLALVFQQKESIEKAIEHLSLALTYSEHEGYTRIYINEGSHISSLMYKMMERKIAVKAVGRLLAEFPVEGPRTEGFGKDSGLIEPVSSREKEVLALIAEGATNHEISQALCIAIGTVKNHLKNIYRKLNVHNRSQAVSRGRDMNLLQ